MNIAELVDEVAEVRAKVARLPRDEVVGRLARALAAFAGSEENQRFAAELPRPGNYTRLLLNSPGDPFQVVLVLWGPGRGSPIHDHDGTIGAVSSLMGRTREIKYQVLHRHGAEVALAEESDLLIIPGQITTILPEDDRQLHLMINETGEWTATVHVYLTAIHRYRVYELQSDKLYRSTENELWFDQINVGRDMMAHARLLAAR